VALIYKILERCESNRFDKDVSNLSRLTHCFAAGSIAPFVR